MKGVKVSEVDIAFLGHRLEGARTARFFVSFLIDTAPAVSRREFNQAPLGLGASTHMVGRHTTHERRRDLRGFSRRSLGCAHHHRQKLLGSAFGQ